MQLPARFQTLPAYAFPRLRELLDVHAAGGPTIHMTIGDPRHDPPPWVMDEIAAHAASFANYPSNDGTPGLRGAIAGWLARRYGATVDAESRILPLNGTREGLFNAAVALCPEQKAGAKPVVLTPNPFYQVYAVAALAMSAEPHYVAATEATGFLPDFASLDPAILDRTAIAYVCSPSNPQGAVADAHYWRVLFGLAEKHDFRVFADECYSEIYRDAAPSGALQVAQEMGADPERLLIFNSLSKRSNLAGLRSGFAAGGPRTIAALKQLRNYAGAPLPTPIQAVSERAWSEEEHVAASRARYVAKYGIADQILAGIPGCTSPEAGFFLWLPVKDGEAAALRVWTETGVRVLPGAYLSRDVGHDNPGRGYIRVALVAEEDEVARGLTAIRDCLYA